MFGLQFVEKDCHSIDLSRVLLLFLPLLLIVVV